MDMSSPAPSFNSLPSSRKGRCVQSSLQCLSPLPQYAMFLFGGHLPSAPPPPPTHTHIRTHARTHARTHTPTHLPNAAQLQKEQVRSEQHAVSPLHHTSASRIFVPIRHFVSVWRTFTTLTPPPPPNSPSPTVSIFRKRRLCHSHQSGFSLVSSWIVTSYQPIRVTPGRITHSEFFYACSKHRSQNHKFV